MSGDGFDYIIIEDDVADFEGDNMVTITIDPPEVTEEPEIDYLKITRDLITKGF